MKKLVYIFAALGLCLAMEAQDYHISFAIHGDSTAHIDSVQVQNLAQGHSLTLQGDEVLHLVSTLSGLEDFRSSGNRLEIVPNPFSDRTRVSFRNKDEGLVELALFTMAGKKLLQKSQLESAGRTCVELRGLPLGAYVIQIKTTTSNFSGVILSMNESGSRPAISFSVSETDPGEVVSAWKSSTLTGNLVEMQYNDGDTLALTAYMGDLSSELKIVPRASSTVTFEFYSNQEDIVARADITPEGGSLQVRDKSGQVVTITFPPAAVMDTLTVSLVLSGEYKQLPITKRRLRTFKIVADSANLYEPVRIQVDYNEPVSDLEKTALFRMCSEAWLMPLSDHSYSSDGRSMNATTYVLGEFAEGEMQLEELNTQFDLLLSYRAVPWEVLLKAANSGKQQACDTRIHKTIWDEWREVIGSFISFFNLRKQLGYYHNLDEGQPTYEEEQELLCTNVINQAISDVLDQCVPENPCDRDYSHTLASMLSGLMLLGCEDSLFNLLQERFDQVVIDCASFLTISSALDIESGGLEIFSAGVVPVTASLSEDGIIRIQGTGTLVVSGSGSAGGPCSSTVSGETSVSVLGYRTAAYTYHLQLFTQQNANLRTSCPDGTVVDTPLVGEDMKEVRLSWDNAFTSTLDEPVEDGTFSMEVTLTNPYMSLY